MRNELEAEGRSVYFAGINAANAAADQVELAKRASFPLFQDLPEVDAWGLHGAGKDDMLLYDSAGRLVTYLPALGAFSTDLSTPDGFKNVKDAVLALH